jgi:hypothetical protein
MQGQILQVEDEKGLILGDDGKRYGFSASDWRGSAPPVIGATVDYLVEDSRARQVFPVPQQAFPRPPHATSNAVLLGWIGIGCLLLGFVIPVLPTIAAFILGLIGADSAKRTGDSAGLLLSRIAWMGAVVILVIGIALLSIGFTFLSFMLHQFLQHMRVTGPGIVA